MGDRGKFEGWYFKHTGKDGVLCIIVGENSTGGNRSAFMQVIANGVAQYIPFDISEYYHDEKSLSVRVGNSRFSEDGAVLDCKKNGIELTGYIEYGDMHPIKGDIMGIFAYVPQMECYHGITSTYHRLMGHVVLNGKPMCFDGGRGYIEGDRGVSFPRRYLWLHSNDFAVGNCSITAAVAEIPLGKIHFTGCIIHLCMGEKQLCFATYYGVKLIANTKGKLIAEQGGYRLELRYKPTTFGELAAPDNGEMNRTILECVDGSIAVKLFYKGRLVLSAVGKNAGIETVKPSEKTPSEKISAVKNPQPQSEHQRKSTVKIRRKAKSPTAYKDVSDRAEIL